MVKADGYGLGMRPVAATLAAAGCRRFFVSGIDEGVALREILAAGAADASIPDASIYVLDGLLTDTEAVYDAHNLVPVLSEPDRIDAWAAHARARGGRPAVIKIDTGMGRLGLGRAEIEALAGAPARLDGLDIDFVMSHLACADEPERGMNRDQLAAFEEMRARLPAAKASLANSAGIFLGPEYHFDIARPGAALYGISSDASRPARTAQVVRLQARILRLRDVDSESAVGYGATRRVPGGSRLATVAVGYADGYPRALSNRGSAFVGDVRVPVVGRVSMDLATFDVTEIPRDRLRLGDSIDLIGPHYSADDLARDAGTIGYEILTGFGARLRRVHIGGGERGGEERG